MPDIVHQFPITASVERVYEAVSTQHGLACWWTRTTSLDTNDRPTDLRAGSTIALDFGPEYQWRADVLDAVRDRRVELEFTLAMPDWLSTHVRIELQAPSSTLTIVRFAHTGWREETEHFRVSSFCWAMYLRLLKRYVELGEIVPYDVRLDA